MNKLNNSQINTLNIIILVIILIICLVFAKLMLSFFIGLLLTLFLFINYKREHKINLLNITLPILILIAHFIASFTIFSFWYLVYLIIIIFSIIHFIWGSLNIFVYKKHYHYLKSILLSYILTPIFLLIFINFEIIQTLFIILLYYSLILFLLISIILFFYGIFSLIKKRKNAFSIIIFTLSLTILFYWSLNTIPNIFDNLIRLSCESKGNLYVYQEGCFENYYDGGKECQDNNECNGNCVVAKENLPNFPKDYLISLDRFNYKYKKETILYFKKLNNLKGKCSYSEKINNFHSECKFVFLENGKLSNYFINREYYIDICESYNK